jgi:hypothetical protein
MAIPGTDRCDLTRAPGPWNKPSLAEPNSVAGLHRDRLKPGYNSDEESVEHDTAVPGPFAGQSGTVKDLYI